MKRPTQPSIDTADIAARHVDPVGTVTEVTRWMESDQPVGPFMAWAGPRGYTQFEHDADEKPTGRWRSIRVSHLSVDLNE